MTHFHLIELGIDPKTRTTTSLGVTTEAYTDYLKRGMGILYPF